MLLSHINNIVVLKQLTTANVFKKLNYNLKFVTMDWLTGTRITLQSTGRLGIDFVVDIVE